ILLGTSNNVLNVTPSGSIGESGFTLTMLSGGIMSTAPSGTIAGGTVAFGGAGTGDPSGEAILIDGLRPGFINANWFLQPGMSHNSWPIQDSGVFSALNLREAPLFSRLDTAINFPPSGSGLIAILPT